MISVIVPIFNTEKYLRKSISTVQKQTLGNLEIILVNDGSTDGSGLICDQLAAEDSRIIVIHQKNGGVSSARNAGLAAARGEYITFFDSDDMIREDMYEYLLKNLVGTDADLSMCGVRIKYMDGREEKHYGTGKRHVLNQKQALEGFLKGGLFTYGVCQKLIKSNIAKDVRYDTMHRINEDKYYLYQILKKAKTIVFEDIDLYYYIKRENSASTSGFRRDSFDPAYFSEEIMKDISVLYPGLSILAEYNHYNTVMNVLRQLYRNKHAVKKYSSQGYGLRKQIHAMEIEKYKKYFPVFKKVEILLLKHCLPVYRIFLPIYDKILKKL